MVRRCGPLATKHAVPAAAMSLHDMMGPVRDTGQGLSESLLQEHLGPDLVDGDGQVK